MSRESKLKLGNECLLDERCDCKRSHPGRCMYMGAELPLLCGHTRGSAPATRAGCFICYPKDGGHPPQDLNPKDVIGSKKWRQFTCVPFTVIWEVGVAMLEGAKKYGPFNWRKTEVRSSVYVDAALGHITQWQEGEDDDPDSGLSHITKAITTLVVMRDAMIQKKFVDERPPGTDLDEIRTRLQERVDAIVGSKPAAKRP